jgi:hypothetical protein
LRVPVDELFDSVEIGGAGLERLNEIFARRKRRNIFALDEGEFFFDLRDDGGKRAAAVAGFVLEAVPAIRIVAGGDHDAAGGLALPYQQADRWRGAGFVGEPDGRASGTDGLSDSLRHAIGCKAVIVADQHAFAGVFAADNIASDSLRHRARIRKRKIFGNDAAPAVRAKSDGGHGSARKYTRGLRATETAGLAGQD